MPTDVLANSGRAIPVEACRLGGGAVKFAATKKDTGNTPIEMLARSAGPIDHWYWGRIVHDMAGMKLHKDVLTCDYEHYDPMGYLDHFVAGSEGLVVRGELVPTNVAGDITTRILQLARGGVPFEASIYFDEDDVVLEYVPEGYVAQVNGTTFEGPGVIAREWSLRGVAVCSYGYDKNTQSKFHRESGNQSYRFSQKEASMPTAKIATQLSDATATEAAAVETKPTEQPVAATVEATAAAPAAEVAAPAAADALSAVHAEIKRFRTAFGDKGPVYFSDGLSFEEASARHVKELVDGHAALAAQNKELVAKLAKATGQPAGELTPVDFKADDQKQKTGLAGHIRIVGTQPAAK